MRTRINPVAAALLAVGLAGFATPARAETEPFGRLEVGQVEALLGARGLVIFDVNSAGVYAKGHLPGAIWSSLADVEKKLPADKASKLVYYCHNER
jgi:Rhodanese-like domain